MRFFAPQRKKIVQGIRPVRGVYTPKFGQNFPFWGSTVDPYPCTDGGDIWRGRVHESTSFDSYEVDSSKSKVDKCQPVGACVGVYCRAPKWKIFAKFRSINAFDWRIPCTMFTKFSASADTYMLVPVLKFGEFRSRVPELLWFKFESVPLPPNCSTPF